MAKSAEAFRTISEVANWLGSPAHVLRFWESKFTQVKPVKRAGGRRYYRPVDMLLLGGIKKLLHDDGMTIKGVQKILREQGVKHVSELSAPLEDGVSDDTTIEGSKSQVQAPEPTTASDSAQVLQFQRETDEPEDKDAASDIARKPSSNEPASDFDTTPLGAEGPAPSDTHETAVSSTSMEDELTHDTSSFSFSDTKNTAETSVSTEEADEPSKTTVEGKQDSLDISDETMAAAENPASSHVSDQTDNVTTAESTQRSDLENAPSAEETGGHTENRLTDIPAFLNRPTPSMDEDSAVQISREKDETVEVEPRESENTDVVPDTPSLPRPATIHLPPDPADDEIDAPAGLLAVLAKRRGGHPLPESVRIDLIAQRDKLSALISRQNGPR